MNDQVGHSGPGDLDTPVIIFSQDSHMSPRFADLIPYCPQEHVHAYLDSMQREQAKVFSIMGMFASENFGDFSQRDQLNQTSGGSWDMKARIADMDRSGVVAGAIFHGGNYNLFPFGGLDYL